jgi:hypothetical protein
VEIATQNNDYYRNFKSLTKCRKLKVKNVTKMAATEEKKMLIKNIIYF